MKLTIPSHIVRWLPLWLLMFSFTLSWAQNTDQDLIEIIEEKSVPEDSFFLQEESSEEPPFRQFDSAEWKKLSDEIDYSKDKFPAEMKVKDIKPSTGPSWNFSGDWVKYLLLGLLALFLIFILLRGFNKTKNEEDPDEEELDVHILSEEKLLELNLEDLLKKALLEADFKMAFRLHYLLLIKLLKDRKYIRWQKEKTNHEYLRELRDTFAYSPFRKITAMYEMIWYGDRPVNEDIYHYFSAEMETLAADLRTGKTSSGNQSTEIKEEPDVE